MSSHPPNEDDRPRELKPEDWRRLMISMADTTWRMFTPPAIFVPAGIYVDLHWHTKPWLTLVGALVGLAIAVVLIKQQLESDE